MKHDNLRVYIKWYQYLFTYMLHHLKSPYYIPLFWEQTTVANTSVAVNVNVISM